MKRAFVYRWRNQLTREWYIGYHVGTERDGYICSSRLARPRIESQKGWQRKILKWGTKSEMVALERRLLTRLQARTNPRSLNQHNGNGHVSTGRSRGSTKKIRPPELLQMIRQVTGRDFIDLLAESYWSAILAGDRRSVEKYHKMFEHNWGPLWFETLGVSDGLTMLTEIKSKKTVSN